MGSNRLAPASSKGRRKVDLDYIREELSIRIKEKKENGKEGVTPCYFAFATALFRNNEQQNTDLRRKPTRCPIRSETAQARRVEFYWTLHCLIRGAECRTQKTYTHTYEQKHTRMHTQIQKNQKANQGIFSWQRPWRWRVGL